MQHLNVWCIGSNSQMAIWRLQIVGQPFKNSSHKTRRPANRMLLPQKACNALAVMLSCHTRLTGIRAWNALIWRASRFFYHQKKVCTVHRANFISQAPQVTSPPVFGVRKCSKNDLNFGIPNSFKSVYVSKIIFECAKLLCKTFFGAEQIAVLVWSAHLFEQRLKIDSV